MNTTDNTDDLPSMDSDKEPLSDTLQKTRANNHKPVVDTDHNHDDLPSVNRRKKDNKLVTVLGFVFIIVAAIALIVAVNSDKAPKKKKQSDDQVANNLPPLAMPEPPPPAPIAQPTPQTVAVAQAIPVKKDATGKPVVEWYDRKMNGTLLVGLQNGASGAATGAGGATATVGNEAMHQAALAGESGRSMPNNELAAKLEPTVLKGTTAALLPDRNFMITKGTSLDCVMETALDTSLPGLTKCQLTRDVYSDNGQVLLLERGSKLVGEFQGGIKQGQVRVFVLWTRAETPNGVIISLNSPGTDSLGRSGLEGWVDNHFWERFGAAILMTVIHSSTTALANNLRSSGSGSTNFYSNNNNGGERIIEKILESTVNIPPTIVKNQGESIQVMVARDLDFSDVYGLEVSQQ